VRKMADQTASCAHCGAQPAASLRRCARCKEASYCGAECQKAAWPEHKKNCTKKAPAGGETVSGAGGSGKLVKPALGSHKAASGGETASAPVPSVDAVGFKVMEAVRACDWRGVISWEGRMEELLESRPDPSTQETLLAIFSEAHKKLCFETGSNEHADRVIRLTARREVLLSKLQRFRDQGEALHQIADHLLLFPDRQLEAARSYSQA